jgi:hypothetical protein
MRGVGNKKVPSGAEERKERCRIPEPALVSKTNVKNEVGLN